MITKETDSKDGKKGLDLSILSKMLLEKKKEEGLSLREIAKQIGEQSHDSISHTTISRILEGKEVDMGTIELIGKWMNVPTATLLNVDKPNEELWNKLQVVFSQHPELYKIFNDFIDGVMNDEVASSILTEIVAYAEFRIKYSKEYGQI